MPRMLVVVTALALATLAGCYRPYSPGPGGPGGYGCPQRPRCGCPYDAPPQGEPGPAPQPDAPAR